IRTSSVDGLNRVFLTGFRSEDEARDFAASGAFAGAFVVRE
ncbi:septal ring lytic transglycosylase RlpA family lipoprotein, partial [Campylobacter jejuni]|nr:septal ring lytic transglycosylase RlpA family lipoprotein [Campylobacter jejuni]